MLLAWALVTEKVTDALSEVEVPAFWWHMEKEETKLLRGLHMPKWIYFTRLENLTGKCAPREGPGDSLAPKHQWRHW